VATHIGQGVLKNSFHCPALSGERGGQIQLSAAVADVPAAAIISVLELPGCQAGSGWLDGWMVGWLDGWLAARVLLGPSLLGKKMQRQLSKHHQHKDGSDRTQEQQPEEQELCLHNVRRILCRCLAVESSRAPYIRRKIYYLTTQSHNSTVTEKCLHQKTYE